jgi:hypothetical protein
MVADARFVSARLRSHGYVQIAGPECMLSIVDRGAAALVAAGRIGAALGEALKAEARRRVATGTFFGHITYASLTASKLPSTSTDAREYLSVGTDSLGRRGEQGRPPGSVARPSAMVALVANGRCAAMRRAGRAFVAGRVPRVWCRSVSFPGVVTRGGRSGFSSLCLRTQKREL